MLNILVVSQALDLLVSVRCMHFCTSTPDLSTLSSTRGLTRLLCEKPHLKAGFTLGVTAALRTARFVELGHPGQRRAGAGDLDVLRQDDGQLVIGHWHVAAGLAMDDGDRAAPVTLAGNAPVAQAELHLLVAQILGSEVGGDGVDRGFVTEAVVLAGIDQLALDLVGIPIGPSFVAKGSFAVDGDDLFDRQVVFQGEGEIAFVVGRDGHYGAIAVAHQDVVADPDFDLVASQRVGDVDAGRHPLLFHRGDVGFGDATLLAFLDEGSEFRVVRGRLGGQRVFGGDGDEGDAHDSVGAGGEHPELFVGVVGEREGEAHAGALADPVLLHQAYLFRPARQVVEFGQQLIGIGGDLHVVHGDLALFNERAGTPAAAVDDLLVGEHGVIDRVPVHGAELFIDQALFVEAGKQPLFPAVVLGRAGGEFAFPVDGEAERLELAAHVVDVGVSPPGRRHVVLQRGIFSRHAEGIPAHRLQYVVALHLVKTREHIADRVVAHVPHVQLARGVREH